MVAAKESWENERGHFYGSHAPSLYRQAFHSWDKSFCLFSLTELCLCVGGHMGAGASGGQKRASDAVEMELQADVSWEPNSAPLQGQS